MPLYVRDETVNELAEQALERVVGEKASEPTLEEKLKRLREKYNLVGRDNPDFDDKAYLAEMWGM